jgi:acetyl-CoA C-acetyltransferase
MGGVLAPLTAAALATQVLHALGERTDLGEDDVGDVILGNGYTSGEISLGRPIGARILASAAYEARRRKARFVLETMCVGGGQGLAAVVEAVR